MDTVYIDAPSLRGRVTIGAGAVESRLPALLAGQKNFAVTDSNVFALYGEFFKKYFSDAELFVLPAGEENKNFYFLGKILGRMTGTGLHRSSRLFAVGGGVVGDIGGLAAALYMRGISCVQIPTTLLAQVDSGVGGKTAVDMGGVKNVVGAFYQPCEVLADPLFLSTLPARELKCGLGEIVKYAALDRDVFAAISERSVGENRTELSFLSSLVLPCVRRKAKVVESDEKESGERKSLNVGHTTGHAIELFLGLSHGESVLWGMALETEIAIKYGVCEKEYGEKLLALVRRALDETPRAQADFSQIRKIAENAKADKKNTDDGEICLSVAKSAGEWALLSLPFAEYKEQLVWAQATWNAACEAKVKKDEEDKGDAIG